MTALKGWTPSVLEPLTSLGLRNDGSRPQANILQQHSSDLQALAFPELFLGPVGLSQNKIRTILGSKHGPWTLSMLHTSANHFNEQQWVSELKQKQWVRPLTAMFQVACRLRHPLHLGDIQCPVAIKAGSFSHTHIATSPPNTTLIPTSWYPFPCFLSFYKLLFHMLHPNPAFPRNMGKRTERRC